MDRHPWLTRRSLLRMGVLCAVSGTLMSPEVQRLAAATDDFIRGPAVPAPPLQRLTPRVAMVYAADGFPTPENRGMMANVVFVLTSAGVAQAEACVRMRE